jgi:hypothetical protein
MSGESFNALEAALDVMAIVHDWCAEQPDDDEHAQEMWEAARELTQWVGAQQAERARLEGEIAALRSVAEAAPRASTRADVKPSTIRKRRQREREKQSREGVTSGVTVTRDSVTSGVTSPSLSDSPSDLSIYAEEISKEEKEEQRESARERSVTVTRDSVTSKRDISFDARLWEQWAQANRRESMGAINHDDIRKLRPALPAAEVEALQAFRRAADAYLADCKSKGKRGHFAFLAKDIGTWLAPAPASTSGAPAIVSPARRLLNPAPKEPS